jgi:hypothetical protein
MFVFCVLGEFWVLRLLVGRDTKNDGLGEKIILTTMLMVQAQ